MKNKFFKTCSGSAFPSAFSHSPQKGPQFKRSAGSSGLAVGGLSRCVAEDGRTPCGPRACVSESVRKPQPGGGGAAFPPQLSGSL